MSNVRYFLTFLCFFISKCIYSDADVKNISPNLAKVLKLTGKTVQDLPSDYETIQIWYPKAGMSLEIHDKNYLCFYAFGKNITTNLEPIQFNLIGENTPIWIGDWYYGTFILEKLPPSTMKQEFLWYATSNKTIIGTGFDNGVAYFVGKVGDMSVIPLNKEESQKLRRRKRDIDNELLPGTEDPTGSFVLSDYHKIYFSSHGNNDDFSDTIITSLLDEARIENMKSLNRMKRDSTNRQEIIRSKILLYADYGQQFIEAKGLIFNSFLMYLVSFWNNVNMYFHYLKDPKVSLQISGIIISKSDLTPPFFTNNRIGFSEIMCRESLTDMNLWLNDQQHIISKNTYDIAITMTSRNLLQSNLDKHTAVYGAVQSSIGCQENQRNTNATAIVNNIKFAGISTAVKELAYLLNVGYRTSLSDKNICNLHDGTAFYIQNSQNPQDMCWLRCYSEPACGYKEDFLDTGKPLPNILPGEIKSLDEQCRLLGYNNSCKGNDHLNCNGSLWCEVMQTKRVLLFWKSEKAVCKDVGFILDGTPCGNNKYCYNKRCIPYVKDVWIQNVSD